MNSILFPALTKKVGQLEKDYSQIAEDRKQILKQLAAFIEKKQKEGNPVTLNFICTHNSRRSHIAQLWAQAAAYYYGINNVSCLSGGTEATAFNPRAVKAMQEAGFSIKMTKDGVNPIYEVRFADDAEPVIAFSKTYDDPFNSHKDFAAIMTCAHADENCPLVIGAEVRISLPFNDPKEYDGTPQETRKYQERVLQIGREICYALSIVKPIG
jgi:arsenate reductase (thioredoxin)